jgi:hypothetical protein
MKGLSLFSKSVVAMALCKVPLVLRVLLALPVGELEILALQDLREIQEQLEQRVRQGLE